MLEEALEIATDADYKFDLAVQLGKLDVAKVLNILSLMFFFQCHRVYFEDSYMLYFCKLQSE